MKNTFNKLLAFIYKVSQTLSRASYTNKEIRAAKPFKRYAAVLEKAGL